MPEEKVGFVGLGIMGKPMAGHLLKAGYHLTVYNRTRSKAEELGKQGAVVADSLAQVAASSDVVFVMVSDTPDVEQVVAGSEGLAPALRPGSVVVDMSTVSPELERRLDALLQGKGCSLIDAPVSGGDIGARNATLAIMAGGAKESFDRLSPLFRVLGKSVTYCGPVGSGQLTKLCNQILGSVALLGVSEAVAFARKNGLDPMTMIEATSGGAASSWSLVNLGPKIVKRDFQPGFMIDLMQKDLRIVLETAASNPIPLLATATAQQLFKTAQTQGWGREGTQALGKIVEQLAGL